MHKITQAGNISNPKITVEMTAKNMTVNAGLLPVVRFMDKLRLDSLVQQLVDTPPRAENANYQFSDVVPMIIAVGIHLSNWFPARKQSSTAAPPR